MTMLSLITALGLLVARTTAKTCMNFTVPVDVVARTANFSLPQPSMGKQGNIDTVDFAMQFTRIGGNYSEQVLTGYYDTKKTYDISARYCAPSNGTASNPVGLVLTHGIGFDKSYWDLSFANYNNSFTNVLVDQHGYHTLAIDRLGVGNSSIDDPVNTIQGPTELAALYQVTQMFRSGSLPGVNQSFSKLVNVGHSFGSALSYELAAMYPNATDGLVLTGFSANGSYLPQTVASWDLKVARLNAPQRFGQYGTNATSPTNLPTGYVTWSDLGSNIYAFQLPGFVNPDLMHLAEQTKQPFTYGELLTIGGMPMMAPGYSAPVLVLTGEQDAIYCGGNCSATAGTNLSSIPAGAQMLFPDVDASNFSTIIQPNTAHALNIHYNSTGAYNAVATFLAGHGLGSS